MRGMSLRSGGAAIWISTLVAFTTVQTRVLHPIGQLRSVGLDVQTSFAMFDRVFEYLDLAVDIDERVGARALDPAEVRGDVTLDGVWFRYSDEADALWTLADVSLELPAGTRLG